MSVAEGVGGIGLRRHLPSFAGPAAFVLILTMVIVPLPPFLLDILFSFNISFSLMILMAALYTTRAVDFSAFPTLLLVTTLLRLSLNVAAARVILLNGYEGGDAAGRVIESFGAFVIGGNYAVGIAVFAIVVIINFVVVTKGSGRIAEVAARFMLDAMPGKQMAIDADLNAGLIDREEATRRRVEVGQEADFFGAMDGASKFVRGDAIAAILILFVNLIGGLAIGMLQHGLGLSAAAHDYTLLTIGDGLVAQIPALVISASAGVIVSRVSNGADVSQQIVGQLGAYPRAWFLGAGIVGTFGIVPGMPHIAFLSFAAGLAGIGAVLNREQKREAVQPKPVAKPADEDAVDIGAVALVDCLSIEVGYALIVLVKREDGVLRRVKAIRRKLSTELGFLVPAVHVRDNADLHPGGYRILLNGVERAAGAVWADKLLAIRPAGVDAELAGEVARDPVFGTPAVWIDRGVGDKAAGLGFTVVEPQVAIALHFQRVVETHAAEVFGRAELDSLLNYVARQVPKLAEDVTPKTLPASAVHRVLRTLLAEGVPLRDMRTILETLVDEGSATSDIEKLVEAVRRRLGRLIIQDLFGSVEELQVIGLSPEAEKLVAAAMKVSGQTGSGTVLEPGLAGALRAGASDMSSRLGGSGVAVALVVPAALRTVVARGLEGIEPPVRVLSYGEIPPDKRIKVIEVLAVANAEESAGGDGA